MVKAVLLIDVSRAESGLDPRLATVEEAKAIRRILHHPVIRGFSVQARKRLKNPTRQGLADAIEQLFHDRDRDQLLILVFSSQGIKHNTGGRYGSTCETPDNTGQKNNSTFVFSAAIATGVVHDLIDQCLARPQAITLDTCGGGDFKGFTAQDEGGVDVRAQLDGKGWTIITSSPPSASQLYQDTGDRHEPNHVSRLWNHPVRMLGVSAVVIFTLAVGSSYALLQTTEDQQAKQSLQRAQAMAAAADYAGCVKAARLIPPNASSYPAAQNALKTCEVGAEISRLLNQANYPDCIKQAKSIPALQPLLNTCQSEQAKRIQLEHDQHLWDTAQQLALSHNLKDAVTHLSQISQQSPVYSEAQILTNRWSNQLLEQAVNAYAEGQYEDAIALAQVIPRH